MFLIDSQSFDDRQYLLALYPIETGDRTTVIEFAGHYLIMYEMKEQNISILPSALALTMQNLLRTNFLSPNTLTTASLAFEVQI